VNLGVEGVAQLADVARELERAFAGIDLGDAEAVIAEPGGDGGDVLIGGSELRAELIGREPLVVAGRAWRVHAGNELAERGFLIGAALQDELQAVKQHAVGRCTTVVGGVGQRVHGVRERNELIFIDGADDADGGCRELGQILLREGGG